MMCVEPSSKIPTALLPNPNRQRTGTKTHACHAHRHERHPPSFFLLPSAEGRGVLAGWSSCPCLHKQGPPESLQLALTKDTYPHTHRLPWSAWVGLLSTHEERTAARRPGRTEKKTAARPVAGRGGDSHPPVQRRRVCLRPTQPSSPTIRVPTAPAAMAAGAATAAAQNRRCRQPSPPRRLQDCRHLGGAPRQPRPGTASPPAPQLQPHCRPRQEQQTPNHADNDDTAPQPARPWPTAAKR